MKDKLYGFIVIGTMVAVLVTFLAAIVLATMRGH